MSKKKASSASGSKKKESPPPVAATLTALAAEAAFNMKQQGTPGGGPKKVRTFFAIRAATPVFPTNLAFVSLAYISTDWELLPKKTLSGGKSLLVQAKKIGRTRRGSYADDTLNLDVTVSNSGVVIGTVSITATVFSDDPWE